MEINSSLHAVSRVMMNIPDSNVMLKNPEDPLQLPTIAKNVAESNGFHGQVGTEVNHEIIFVNESNHKNLCLQGRHSDCFSLIFQAFPTQCAKFFLPTEKRTLSKNFRSSRKFAVNVADDNRLAASLLTKSIFISFTNAMF
jgi:hypothetical protein